MHSVNIHENTSARERKRRKNVQLAPEIFPHSIVLIIPNFHRQLCSFFHAPSQTTQIQPQNKAFVCLLFKGTNMSMPFDFNSKRRRRRVRESRVECQISIINLMPIDYSNDSLYMHIVDNR